MRTGLFERHLPVVDLQARIVEGAGQMVLCAVLDVRAADTRHPDQVDQESDQIGPPGIDLLQDPAVPVRFHPGVHPSKVDPARRDVAALPGRGVTEGPSPVPCITGAPCERMGNCA